MNYNYYDLYVYGLIISVVSCTIGYKYAIHFKTIACRNCCDRQYMDQERKRKNNIEPIWMKHHW